VVQSLVVEKQISPLRNELSVAPVGMTSDKVRDVPRKNDFRLENNIMRDPNGSRLRQTLFPITISQA